MQRQTAETPKRIQHGMTPRKAKRIDLPRQLNLCTRPSNFELVHDRSVRIGLIQTPWKSRRRGSATARTIALMLAGSASLMARAAAFRVEPVVSTSSTSATCLPLICVSVDQAECESQVRGAVGGGIDGRLRRGVFQPDNRRGHGKIFSITRQAIAPASLPGCSLAGFDGTSAAASGRARLFCPKPPGLRFSDNILSASVSANGQR